jgi:hypothetical protein
MFSSIGTASDTPAPAVLHLLPAHVGHPGHVDEQVVGAELVGRGERIEGRAHAEAADDVRHHLQPELAPEGPGRLEARQVDLAAHGHGQELVVGAEVLRLDAGGIRRILVAGDIARALEVAEHAAPPRVGQALDRGVGVLREWWIWEMSCTVVTPASIWLSAPNSSLM